MATTLNERDSFVTGFFKIKKQGHGRRSSFCALSFRAFTHRDERWGTKQEYNVAVQQQRITVRPIHPLRKDANKCVQFVVRTEVILFGQFLVGCRVTISIVSGVDERPPFTY
jgi:hypothetical protein